MGGINHQKHGWFTVVLLILVRFVPFLTALFAVIKVPSKHSGPRLALSQVSGPDPHLCRVAEQMLEGCGSLGLLKQIYPERIYIYIYTYFMFGIAEKYVGLLKSQNFQK